MSIFTLNGVADDDLNLSIPNSGGLGAIWSGPETPRSSTPVLARHGSVPALVATGAPKIMRVVLALEASVAQRRARFDDTMRTLDGVQHIEWVDTPGYVQVARLDARSARARFESVAFNSGTVDGSLLLELDFILDNPLFFAKDVSQIAVSSTAMAIPLGTEPCCPLFRFSGATSALTLTYRHGMTGSAIYTLTLTGTTASGTVLEIDSARETLYTWDTTTGARINRLTTTSLYSSGDFPIFDPNDGTEDFPPTIESNHSGLVWYRNLKA